MHIAGLNFALASCKCQHELLSTHNNDLVRIFGLTLCLLTLIKTRAPCTVGTDMVSPMHANLCLVSASGSGVMDSRPRFLYLSSLSECVSRQVILPVFPLYEAEVELR